MGQKIVYVVTVHKKAVLNQRIRKLLMLREYFTRMVLVCGGDETVYDDDVWEIRHAINPTGVLRKLGLEPLKGTIDNWLYFPSPQVLFVKAVQRALSRAIRRQLSEGAEVTVVTCVPNHALGLLGLALKKEFPNLRWVMDWQDLWSHDPYYMMRIPLLYRGRLLRTERQILESCDMNVTTNPYAAEVLERQYEVPSERVTSIYHPFGDDEDANANEPVRRCTAGNRVRIAFLGSLFKPPKVPGDKVLDALRYVRQKGVDIELELFGNAPQGYEEKLAAAGVSQHGFIEGKEIILRLRRSDFQLLVLEDLPSCRIIMHAKLPQYLLAGKPIIAIAPRPSAVADIVQETGSGYVIPAQQDWGVELHRLLADYLAGTELPERNEKAVQQFNWNNLAPRWLEIL
ncbi:MAG TPA: hypothetical protein ENJ43_04920 [Gammaproteobacteria bacterium]|nr:hypothetical protein [Gammaproteobacteria bacterium]